MKKINMLLLVLAYLYLNCSVKVEAQNSGNSGGLIEAKTEQVKQLFIERKYTEALDLINTIQSIDNSDNRLNRVAAYSYYEIGQFQKGLVSIELFFKNVEPEKIYSRDYAYYGKLLAKDGKSLQSIEKFNKALQLDTTDYSLYSEIAKSYSNEKNWSESAKYYEMKIAKSPSITDKYGLGRCYFNMKMWRKADEIFTKLVDEKPDFMMGIRYCALNKTNLDTTYEKGLAKPYYEKLIALALKDSVKYSKDLKEAYSYLGYYYSKQFNIRKKCEDAKIAIKWSEKVIGIDPKDERSAMIIKNLENECP